MARILVVKPFFPYPPHQGTRRVSLALLEDLATEHEVVYLCQLEDRAEAALIPKLESMGVRVVASLMPNRTTIIHKTLYKLRNRTLSTLTGVPEICLYWANRVLRSNLERIVEEFQPDLTILENWETYGLRRSVRSGIVALLAHDAAFRIRERAADAAKSSAQRARLSAEARRYKKLEVRSWTLFDAVLSLTEDDRATIERELSGREEHMGSEEHSGSDSSHGQTPDIPLDHSGSHPIVRHLPVPVPGELFSRQRPTQPGLKVGFMGSFRADFNLDALTYLLREIWPVLKRRTPGAELVLAGNGYDGPLKHEAQQLGARWMGFVEQIGAFFESIDALLVPLRFGGGVRIRILEALAAGVPVVATPVAVAGLEIEDGQHCAVASGPTAIAEAVSQLLANPQEAKALGKEGRQWCWKHHSPEVLRPVRLAVVQEILKLGLRGVQ
ncbi:MAG: glycosyltransferase family 4 protein [Candidatus Eisenbacteria sp.]|nr:glycosyltransferase family 4 protein [Candidatus Eisenbacteria bacterium]